MISRNSIILIVLLLGLTMCKTSEEPQPVTLEIRTLEPPEAQALAQKINDEATAKVADGLELSLWASDSLLADPIALRIDQQGRVYISRTNRQKDSEFDIRGHRDWMTASISLQTVEDRRKFLRETFAPEKSKENSWFPDLNKDSIVDWRDLTVQKEEVFRVEDRDGDGLADFSQLYIRDFNEEITDCAGAVLPFNDDVYIGVGPDMWRTTDTDGDGMADKKESISHGYNIHIGFGAHGMSGLTVGPDGRIYWGAGDIGTNVIDKEGNHWKYPNQGTIVRCEPDGTGFEVFAAGLRNTHEFVFDEYGNLFSEDNDGDHRGERERLVYITNGSDTGWRINWQFGKYTDPDNNGYKVWMDENMHVPRNDQQAAYFIPPIKNYHNGPTGMLYNPGTALGPQWENHFFIAEFVGNPSRSNIHAFKMKPSGAGFDFDSETLVMNGVLATGMDFGPDGALYFGDWINGWGTKDYGRIWKLDAPDQATSNLRLETKKLVGESFSQKEDAQLGELLGYPDYRVRQKAQFELATRGKKGQSVLQDAIAQTENQLARVHGIWGIWQLARKKETYAKDLLPLLEDGDAEIVAQAAKVLGDIRYQAAGDAIIPLLKHDSPRVQFFAAEALGRMEHKAATDPLIDLLLVNDNKDIYLRHAGSLALARIGDEAAVAALSEHDSRSLRIAAVVALRRMKSPEVSQFLTDEDEYIVAEAARAINDDFSIEPALPALANVLKETRFTSEPLLRRAINANSRLGKAENLQLLVDFAKREDVDEEIRAEAMATLSVWAKPSVLDRVDGRYRGKVERDPAPVKAAMEPLLAELLQGSDDAMRITAITAAGKLGIAALAQPINELFKNGQNDEVKIAALKALDNIDRDLFTKAITAAISMKSSPLRSEALGLLSEIDYPADGAVTLYSTILEDGSTREKQTVLKALGEMKAPAANTVLGSKLEAYKAGSLDPDLELELVEALEESESAELMANLNAHWDAKRQEDPLAPYRMALQGGNPFRGRRIFNNDQAAQCIRCHTVFEFGGEVGPSLANIGHELDKEHLLEALVLPSARLAPGFGMATLTLQNDEIVGGVIDEEDENTITLRLPGDEKKTFQKADLKDRQNIPSSMPPMGDVLSKRQLRDLVSFLSTLTEEET
ncbi:MAG: HEAT repeat domain-containing protein [Saprospiraceae bacterium]|nr:HEAT repeat domain-containing protein [Saprospiraceae bacterium]